MHDPRVMELVEGLVSGELDPRLDDELLRLLQVDPALLDEVLDQIAVANALKANRFTSDLRQRVRAALEQPSPAAPDAASRRVAVSSGRRPLAVSGRLRSGRHARRRRRSRPLVGVSLVAAVLILIAIAAIVQLRPSAGIPQPTQPSVQPPPVVAQAPWVEVLRRSGERIQRSRLHAGESLRCAAGETAELRFEDGSLIALEPDSLLTLQRLVPPELQLQHGQLDAQIRAQPQPMLLRTPTLRVAVLGTRFVLEHQDDRDEVRLSEGRLELAGEDRAFELPSGYACRFDRGVLAGIAALGNASQDLAVPLDWIRKGGHPSTEISEDGRQIRLVGDDPGSTSILMLPVGLDDSGAIVISGEVEVGAGARQPRLELSPLVHDSGQPSLSLEDVLRLDFKGDAIELLSRRERGAFTSHLQVPLAAAGPRRFELRLEGQRLRLTIDGQVVYDGEHLARYRQPGQALGLWWALDDKEPVGAELRLRDLRVTLSPSR